MTRRKIFSRIFGIAVAFLVIGAMLSGLLGAITLQTAQASTLADGKGMWIWKIWELSDGVTEIINKLESAGVRWVTIKCGDSNSYYPDHGYMYNWLQTNGYSDFGEVVTQFHNAAIKVFGWHYVYSEPLYSGTGYSTEADVSNEILDIAGIDGLIIDAETQYEGEGKGPIAEAYMIDIRSEHPGSFIVYSTFARINSHLWFPYIEFGRYCDAVMPQAYWKDRPTTPQNEVDIMKQQWDYWHGVWADGGYGDSVKPLIPVGQSYSDAYGYASGSEITEFCTAVSSYGYDGVSLWRYGKMTSEAWSAYAAIGGTDTAFPTVNAFSVSPSSVTLGNAFTISYTVADTGGSGLNRAELWRANDSGGSPVGWAEVKRTSISGNGPYPGSFTDAPPSIGTYWYGIHVVDNAGNWNDEGNSHTGGSPGVFGPIEVEVIGPNQLPQLSNGYVEPTSGILSTDFYYYVAYFDPDGDSPSVKQVFIDGIAYTMDWYQGLNSHITYRFGPKNLSAGGTHYYFFYFEDGRGGTARLPSGTDMYLGPSVTPETYPPRVTTNAASSITTSSASLNGNLDSSGGLSCQVWFEWWWVDETGLHERETPHQSMSSAGPFSAGISDLSPGETHNFRAYASNSEGTSYGLEGSFTTLAPEICIPSEPIDFSDVNVGDLAEEWLEIWNLGTATLTINSITRTSGSSDFSPIYGYTPFDIEAGESDLFLLFFQPSSEGSKNATFTINSNDPYQPDVTFSVSGNGTLAPNNPPNTPSNLSPSDGTTDVSLTPTLQSSAFSDPNVGDIHAASHWQITTNQRDYSSPVFDSGVDATNLTSITIPAEILDYATTCYWHIRHQDNHGAWSEWSEETLFTTTSGEVVNFPDPNLEAAIREAIGKPTGDIYQSDLQGLTEFDASFRGISDLAGLEYCVNLNTLNLDGNQISNLHPVSNLTSLRGLWLGGNQISNISSLSNLTNLEELDLMGNDITDLQPLSNLVRLRLLDLHSNEIGDLNSLSYLIDLRGLGLSFNQISDLTPISNLVKLEFLGLGENQVTNIHPLCNLLNLERLNLKGNQISSLEPLTNLTNLKDLELGANQISDLSSISNLTNLLYLYLEGNKISDVSMLAGLTKLRALYLDDNDIANITVISAFTNLGENGEGWWCEMREGIRVDLALRNNQIADISPLLENAGLGEGDGIDLRGNPLSTDSLDTYIPQLQERGVNVLHGVPKTWYVDDNLQDYPDADFTRIQEAVNTASSGDTIIVYPGTYTENVDVNKEHLTIQSENGSEVTIVQAANPNDHVFEVAADYVNISGFTAGGAFAEAPANYSSGIYLHAEYCDICRNTLLNNNYGILLWQSSFNTLSNNTVSDNYWGIGLSYLCSHNIISNNKVCSNLWGINLHGCSNNTLLDNEVLDNEEDGIRLEYASASNTLTSNTATGNGTGMFIYSSPDNILSDNIMSANRYNFGVYGYSPSDFSQSIATSNMTDGKPIHYIVNKDGLVIDSSWDIGYLGIVNCTNITVKDLNLANNWQGLLVACSTGCQIKNVTASDNFWAGIYLYQSSGNSLINNIVLNNSEAGIHLLECFRNTLSDNSGLSNGDGIRLEGSCNNIVGNNNASNNNASGFAIIGSSDNTLGSNIASNNPHGIFLLVESCRNILTKNTISNNSIGVYLFSVSNSNIIYLNDFTNNNINALSNFETNIWNSPEEITYTYSRKPYTNYLGNYWSDYTGDDVNGDGIGDSPYSIDSDNDNYPLMEPFENYVEVGYAVIVAGQGGWREEWGFDHGANNAYRVLRNLGFSDDHIFYLNSNGPQDIDEDGNDEVDAPASLSDFENTINKVRSRIGNTGTLIIYLMGHGLPGQFLFDESCDCGYSDGCECCVTDIKLKQMLDEFPSRTRMLIFINSCYSGSFITSPLSGISDPNKNRIIITGAHDDNERWGIFGTSAVRSSDRFWANLNKGLSVKDAFTTDTWPGEWWHLWLDDNGDKTGHPPNNLADDGGLAAVTQIGLPGTENLELTPWLFVGLRSPGELRVYDSQNRVTGLVNGEVKEEIPDSIYDEQNEIVVIYSPSDTYRYEVIGTDESTYGLDVTFVEDGEAATFAATEVPITTGAVYDYTIDWNALSEGEKGVTIRVDSDGDGEFEETIITTPPNTPSEPSPSNDATSVSVNAGLTWIGGDPDEEDNVTYKVYFGTDENPLLVSEGQSGIAYNPGILSYNVRYYWRVVARDNHGITSVGPIWDFTTEPAPNTPPEVSNVTASQGLGIVNIAYDVSDAEQSEVSISFEYWDGASWQACVTTTGDGTQSTGTGKSGTWDAKTDFDEHYMPDCKIRVTADDGQAENNIGTGESNTFTLDTKDPTGFGCNTPTNGATSVSINPDLTCLTASDDSSPISYYFQLAENDTFSLGLQESSWQSSTTWSPSTLEYNKQYFWRVKAKDSYANETDYSSTFNFTSGGALMEGDVNLNGHVTISDAMLIAQHLVGIITLNADQLESADTTDDGNVTISDAMHIAQWLVDPDGTLGVLFKPLWESPVDDHMLHPLP